MGKFFQRHVQHAPGDAVVDAGDPLQRPGEDTKHEEIHAGRAGRQDAGNLLRWRDAAFEDRIVAAGGAHAERVPGLFDVVTLAVARQEPMHDLGCRRVAGIHGVEPEPRPDRRERTEGLRPSILWPPSTAVAFVVEKSSGMSLPDSAWPAAKTSPLPASSSSHFIDSSPMR